MAIRSASDGRVVLSFELPGGGSHEETFDHVVLTLPFTQLRTVEIEEGLIAQDKAEIIAELGYGQNAKLMMQLESRPWREAMAGGAGFTDNGAQTFWDSARGQAGAQGILTHFAGGDGGLALGTGTAADQAARILPLMDAIFPGTQAAFNGMALRMHWPTAPYHGGSYACYRPGQWAYYGVEGEARGAPALRRRAHQPRVPGLHGGRGRERRAGGHGHPRGPRPHDGRAALARAAAQARARRPRRALSGYAQGISTSLRP
ncbi:MAG: FAD-dependent oxidoreductase [Sandaracinaceae bacterium]|nr:FAD-dependent oxidoreductase [Sandaracinaceae bacterium]